MSGFEGLPNELVLRILELADPDDLQSLSHMSQTWYELARPLLQQHKERKATYHNLRYPCSWPKTLVCILQSPEVARYIRNLEVNFEYDIEGSTRRRDMLFYSPDDVTGFLNSSDAALLDVTFKSSPLLVNLDIDDWRNSFVRNHYRIAALFLYTLLPKLKMLSLRVTNYYAKDLAEVMHAIALEHGGNAQEGVSLAELKYIYYESHLEGQRPTDIDIVRALAALPRVVTMKIADFSHSHFDWSLELPASNLTSLIFVGASYELGGICTLLTHIHGLRRFCFFENNATSVDSCEPMFKALRTHHAQCLQVLAFELECYYSLRNKHWYDLSVFENIRAAYVPWRFVSHMDRSAKVEPLPRLCSLGITDSLDADLAAEMMNFIEQYASAARRFERFLLVVEGSGDLEGYTSFASMMEECKEIGIAVKVKEWGYAHDMFLGIERDVSETYVDGVGQLVVKLPKRSR